MIDINWIDEDLMFDVEKEECEPGAFVYRVYAYRRDREGKKIRPFVASLAFGEDSIMNLVKRAREEIKRIPEPEPVGEL